MKAKPLTLARTSAVALATASALFVLSSPAAAQEITHGQAAATNIFNGNLRDLPVIEEFVPGRSVMEGPKRRIYPRGEGPLNWTTLDQPDPLLAVQQRASAGLKFGSTSRAFTTPTLNFDGQGNSFVSPPDTVGDIGPTYYIQMINGGSGTPFQVFNKSTGVSVAGPTNLHTLWSGSGACSSGRGDPIVNYDQLANRWVLSEFAGSGNHLCVYVSQTSDPVAGGWYAYDFSVPQFPDYPKYGVWNDAYYVGTNENAPTVYALDRAKMLAGDSSAAYVRLTAPALSGFGFQMMQPADADGTTAPPAGSPGMLFRQRDDEVHNAGSNNSTEDYLEIWNFDVDFSSPGSSTLTKAQDIAMAEFESELCGLSSFECAPQPGTANGLDPLREVVMHRVQYRNMGSYEVMVGNFVTDVAGGSSDHHGIRWFELRRTTGASNWTLHQEGTWAPDSHHRWMGSIAMDGSGNIALGYSISSSTLFPGMRYVGRTSGDTAGTMTTGEITIVAGSSSQTGSTRWGDYSSMNVDPVDECTFWYTNEYMPSGGSWTTRIASFRFDSPTCTGGIGECGNDTVEGGEQCDGSDLGSCPLGPCDPDCTCPDPVCGNNVVESGESCDGSQLGSCSVGPCDGDCTCPAPVCGNDIIEEGEACDGTATGDCPTGSCAVNCQCPDPACGNNVVETGEECDGTQDSACPGQCNAAGSGADECQCQSTTGDCCEVNQEGEAGCSDPTIEACVCALDPFCCDEFFGYWDSICVDEVDSFGCGTCEGGPTTTTTTTAPPTTTTTTTTTTVPTGGLPDCPATSSGVCDGPLKGSLSIKDNGGSTKLLKWKWLKGSIPVPTVFGDPVFGDTGLATCVYNTTLASELQVAGGTGWSSNSKGFKYKDTTLSQHGVKIIKLQSGNSSKLQLQARGESTPMPTPAGPGIMFDMSAGVVVQMHSATGNCWSTGFSSVDVKKNRANLFKAKK